jgi:peptide/nickel transport system ATP-binding protein
VIREHVATGFAFVGQMHSHGQSASSPIEGCGDASVLTVRGLRVEFATLQGLVVAPNGVDFDIAPGEILGIVGESGSGKSTTARSIIQLVPKPGVIVDGEIWFQGRNLVGLAEEQMNRIRGRDIGYVFQDSRAALNPLLTVGDQIRESLRVGSTPGSDVVALLDEVGIPDAGRRQHDYPHQFSGGMCQRVMIAMAVANRPALLIADEPTSALDVTTQAQILELLRALTRTRAMAMILISHDMAVVSGLCDRVIVMYGGLVMEHARIDQLVHRPQHPYTRALLACSPGLQAGKEGGLQSIEGNSPNLLAPPSGCIFHPRCAYRLGKCREKAPPYAEIDATRRSACWLAADGIPLENAHRTVVAVALHPPMPDSALGLSTGAPPANRLLELVGVEKRFRIGGGARLAWWADRLQVRAVDGVSLAIDAGETLALVGESGSGKSTVGRLIARVYRPDAGQVLFDGADIGVLSERRMRELRQRIQMILQDPYSSLNPRMTVEDIVSEPLRVHPSTRGAHEPGNGSMKRGRLRMQVIDALHAVGLDKESITRYPHQFSGGQRQRISIARALVLRPSLVIADEPVSSLDVSAQAQIVGLLKRLQKELRLTYLFIAHDLALVRHVADRVAVMYLGKIVECGPVDMVFEHPRHPYTSALLSAALTQASRRPAAKRIMLKGEIPSPVNPPSGCRFRTRCPIAQTLCAEIEPPESSNGSGHVVACHFAAGSGSNAMTAASSVLEH